MPDEPRRPTAAELVQQATTSLPPAAAVLALSELATRVMAELQRVARQEAEAHRGEAAWGGWAKLANAARTGALQVASCRDAARQLAPDTQQAPE